MLHFVPLHSPQPTADYIIVDSERAFKNNHVYKSFTAVEDLFKNEPHKVISSIGM